jgi:NADH-quinone oxidoreductase subunit E
MLTEELRRALEAKIAGAAHPQEYLVDVLFALQDHYGHLTDEAVVEAAEMVGMPVVAVEELTTFYPFLYREPVGRYVINVCDSVVCWMDGHESIQNHLMERLGIAMGETTADGLFTLLPVCCIGYCDRAPAILVNKKVYGELTPEKLDDLLETLRREAG